ncbi:MAG: glycosyltransferase family 39 protein [Patescibacteria group bacterium]|nr:glycosyltransferase family 39 protein [Patescibacteria group bacterium]
MDKYILLAILSLAVLLRVLFIHQYPNGFTPDEASFGYDAYSILHTGRDQWGRFLPLVLESFGDFKAPLYAYLLVPFVAFFGLEVWVVRLPNALLSVFAVLVTYFLIKHIRMNYLKSHNLDKFKVELLASFLLAVSPWHVQLSRGAFEANLTSFFMPLGILLFLKGLENYKFLLLSAFVFGLNLFTYHAARFVTPIVVGILVMFFLKKLIKVNLKYLIVSLAVFAIFFLVVVSTFFQGGLKRAQDVSIFRGALEAQAEARLKAIQSGLDPTLAKITNNKYLVVARRFKDNYIKYFSKEFLVTRGPGEATYGMVPGIGVVYFIEVVALIFFVFFAILSKNKMLIFILIFLLIAVLPAALTMGVGYAANRAATMLPFIHVASALGFAYFVSLIKKINNLRYAVNLSVFILILFVFYQLGLSIQTYLGNQNDLVAKAMLYGRIELFEYLNSSISANKVVISRRLSEPHIYLAFVNKIDPLIYQKNAKDWVRYREEGLTFLDQMYKYSLGKYTFQAIESSDFNELSNGEILVVLPEEMLPNVNLAYETINYPSGEIAFFIVRTL